MIFKKCSACSKELGPHNSHDIKLFIDPAPGGSALSGLYFTHSREDCHSTNFLPLREIKARSELKANGDPWRQIEIDWYKQRLEEVKK